MTSPPRCYGNHAATSPAVVCFQRPAVSKATAGARRGPSNSAGIGWEGLEGAGLGRREATPTGWERAGAGAGAEGEPRGLGPGLGSPPGLPLSPSGCPAAPRLSAQAHTHCTAPLGSIGASGAVPASLVFRLLGTAQPQRPPVPASFRGVASNTARDRAWLGPSAPRVPPSRPISALGCYQPGDNAETARR